MLARFRRSIATILAGTMVLFTVTSPAMGQDSAIVVRGLPQGTKMEMVPYGDLNLRFIAHLNILNHRVGTAVRNVCEYEARELVRGGFGYENCESAAWAGARPQIHRAYLRANRLASLR